MLNTIRVSDKLDSVFVNYYAPNHMLASKDNTGTLAYSHHTFFLQGQITQK